VRPEASSEGRGRMLLDIARASIEGRDPQVERGQPWLDAPGASFVTLQLDGQLRGCIGSLEASRPLAEDVAYNARAAAFRDPRFAPVSDAERERLQVEVSVLSPAEPLPAANEAEAIAKLRPGRDGLIVEFGERRATFLPQVWESLERPEDFLAELWRKAGLPARFWHPELRLARYSVEKFR
jgi:AmmeMemoRadiSam system protein A